MVGRSSNEWDMDLSLKEIIWTSDLLSQSYLPSVGMIRSRENDKSFELLPINLTDRFVDVVPGVVVIKEREPEVSDRSVQGDYESCGPGPERDTVHGSTPDTRTPYKVFY